MPSRADDREPTRLTLLCQNRSGFKRLSALLTRSAALGSVAGRNVVLKEWLDVGALEGLIGLSGAQAGELGRALAADRDARAPEVLDYWRTLLPQRFYVELQRLGRPGESAYLGRAVELASARGVPVVATNDVCFLGRDDFEAHETRVCIGAGRDARRSVARRAQYSEEQYLKSAPEMAALFADLPEALANTVEIAKRCSLELDLGRVFLPDFAADDGSAPRAYLKSRARARARRALAPARHRGRDEPRYRERLARELEVIVKMGFEGYFLIVADFIAWARGELDPGRARVAARASARWPRTRSASRTWIRSRTT